MNFCKAILEEDQLVIKENKKITQIFIKKMFKSINGNIKQLKNVFDIGII